VDFVGRNKASSRNVGVAGVEVGYQVGKGAARRIAHVGNYKHDPANFPAQPKIAFRRMIMRHAPLETDPRKLDMSGQIPYIRPDRKGGATMRPEMNRTARIEARIAPDVLAIVKRAAELQGRSVSDFVVAAAQEAASRAIEENHIIRLSVEDQRAFAEAILDPPAPSKGLLRAAEAYRTLIKESL
jgi:uncharacterized protein (DUF1778 family)